MKQKVEWCKVIYNVVSNHWNHIINLIHILMLVSTWRTGLHWVYIGRFQKNLFVGQRGGFLDTEKSRPTIRAGGACARAHMREFKRAYASMIFEKWHYGYCEKFMKEIFDMEIIERFREFGGETFRFNKWIQWLNLVFFALLISLYEGHVKYFEWILL